MTYSVRDNVAKHRFELEADGAVAFAEYGRQENVTTIRHTEVPESLAGRGIGSALARGALDLVRAEDGKVVAECPFVAQFIAKHKDYEDLVAAPGADDPDNLDARLDEGLNESFPASDPLAVTPKH